MQLLFTHHMTLRTHALSITAMIASCSMVTSFVFADGLTSQWKARTPISNIDTGVVTDMKAYDTYAIQKRTDTLNAADLAKLLVDESARLVVRKGKQVVKTETVAETPAPQIFTEVQRVRSVKKAEKPLSCANLHTHDRAECLSRQAYTKTSQFKATLQFQTAEK
jgi:hypothetical protein